MPKCDHCNCENPNESIHCYSCGHEFKDAAPITKLTKAGFWIRVLARMIDLILAAVVGYIASYTSVILLMLLEYAGFISPGWQQRIQVFSFAFIGLGFLGDNFYRVMCEGIHGATFGKLCCGICVVSENGQPSKMVGALIRTLAFQVDGIFFGAVGYTSMEKSSLNQRYGDVWGKTAVLKTSEIAPESRRTPAQFLIALLLGISGWITLVVIGLIIKAS